MKPIKLGNNEIIIELTLIKGGEQNLTILYCFKTYDNNRVNLLPGQFN